MWGGAADKLWHCQANLNCTEVWIMSWWKNRLKDKHSLHGKHLERSWKNDPWWGHQYGVTFPPQRPATDRSVQFQPCNRANPKAPFSRSPVWTRTQEATQALLQLFEQMLHRLLHSLLIYSLFNSYQLRCTLLESIPPARNDPGVSPGCRLGIIDVTLTALEQGSSGTVQPFTQLCLISATPKGEKHPTLLTAKLHARLDRTPAQRSWIRPSWNGTSAPRQASVERLESWLFLTKQPHLC